MADILGVGVDDMRGYLGLLPDLNQDLVELLRRLERNRMELEHYYYHRRRFPETNCYYSVHSNAHY